MTTSAPSRSLKWPTILNYAIAVVSAAISVVAAVALYPLWGAGATLFLCVVTFVALAASLQLQRKNQQMKIGELQEQNDRLRIETAELSEAATSARGAEQEMRQTVDMVPALIARYRADGYMDFRNKNWREYTGLSRDNLEGRRWGSALHPDEEEMVERLWREHIATGEPFELEQRLRQADGEYRWHRVRRVPLRGESGEVIKWYAIAFDVDDRKRTEDALRESEADLAKARHELQLIIDTIPVLVLRHRADGIIDFVNEVGRVYSGITRTTWPSRTSVITHPDDVPRLEAAWDVALRTGESFESEVRLRRADGRYRWFFTRRVPLRRNGEVIAWYAATTDIEDRKQAERELIESERRFREAQMELAHAGRVVSMGQLTASIAHEVNQPLAALLTNAGTALRWLAGEPPNLEKATPLIERVVDDGRRAADILSRIRDFSKKAPLRKESLDVNEAISEIMGLTHSAISEHRVSTKMQLADGLPQVLGDKVQLQQVMLNLIMNAIEALSEVSEGSRELLISTGEVESEGVLVSVSDSGPGLPPTDVARIFEAFHTTKASGLGLGLSICRSIVEAHGGRLWATPNEPRGAIFCMMLPIGQRPPGALESSEA